MTDRSYSLDMGMMYAMHDALRRELERIARISARADDDPQRILRTAVGWQLFKSYLLVHHTAEDDAAWAVMEQQLADQPSDLALLQAMELEHAAIDPLLKAIDAAAADRERRPRAARWLGGRVDHQAECPPQA